MKDSAKQLNNDPVEVRSSHLGRWAWRKDQQAQ